MENRILPVLQISRTSYHIDLQKMKLVNVANSSDEIQLENIKGVLLEDDFLVYFDEKSQKVYKPPTPSGPFPPSVAMYRFDGIDLLDPIGYARLRGLSEDLFRQFYKIRANISADRYPVPTVQRLVAIVLSAKRSQRKRVKAAKSNRRKR